MNIGLFKEKSVFNFLFVFFILFISCINLNLKASGNWDIYSLDKNVFQGSILFPKDIKKLPNISIYRRGLKIKTEEEASNHKIQFTISEDKSSKRFYLIISKEITPKVDDNTVKYLTVDTSNNHKNYKFYELALFTNQELVVNPKTKQEEIKENSFWSVQRMKLGKEGVIPDDTLMIIFNPDYVDKIEGGNSLELPSIVLIKNLIKKAGSEKKFTDETNELVLSSCFDLNIIHSNETCTEFRPEKNKKVVIAMAKPD